MRYLLLGLLVLAINVAPFLAPPTWTVIVFYRLNSNMNVISMIAIAVFAAASGRYILGSLCHKLRFRIKGRYRDNLEQARIFFEKRRGFKLAYFLFVAVSPMPSAQMFEGAGLIGVELIPLTFFFAIGRLVSYSLYALGASTVKASSLGNLIVSTLKSPWGIALEAIGLLAIAWVTSRPNLRD